MELGLAYRNGTSSSLIQNWHEAIKDLMFLCGLRTDRQIIQTVNITALTSKAIKLGGKQPIPIPPLKSTLHHDHSTTTEAMEDTRRELHFYHSLRGVPLNVSQLTWVATTARPLPTPAKFPCPVLCIMMARTGKGLKLAANSHATSSGPHPHHILGHKARYGKEDQTPRPSTISPLIPFGQCHTLASAATTTKSSVPIHTLQALAMWLCN